MNKRKLLKRLVCFIPSQKLRKHLREKYHLKYLPFSHYGTRYIYNEAESNDLILKTLQTGKPCLIIRFGRTELKAIEDFYGKITEPCIEFTQKVKEKMRNNAGFFPPTDEKLTRFCCESLKVLSNADLIACWNFYNDFECRLVEKHNEAGSIISIGALGDTVPFVKSPWTQYLKGKKVLVIHPFEATIQKQYKIREKLFKNPLALPAFQLKTIKAVQGIGGSKEIENYKDWFDALETMCRKIDQTDFDIALIGAGAYGMFLGDYIKRKGKQAVHIGGSLQILFGIKGTRWTKYTGERNFSRDVYNEYWTDTAPEDLPEKMEKFIKYEGDIAYW